MQTSGNGFDPQTTTAHAPSLMTDWQFQQAAVQLSYNQDPNTFATQYQAAYGVGLQASPIDFMTAPQTSMGHSLQLEQSYLPLAGSVDMPFNFQSFGNELSGFTGQETWPDMSFAATHGFVGSSSPTDTLEVRSLTSSSSDNGWTTIDHHHRRSIDSSFQDHAAAIFNPGQTLHNRTFSDSSYSDLEQQTRQSFEGYIEVPPYAIQSPESESHDESHLGHNHISPSTEYHHSTAVSPAAVVRPIPIKKPTSPMRSPTSSVSPPSKKPTKKSPISKATEKVIRKQSQIGDSETKKRVGRRKGPLRPEQRKQASEIRKMRACLRCKFLKKTVSNTVMRWTFPRQPLTLV